LSCSVRASYGELRLDPEWTPAFVWCSTGFSTVCAVCFRLPAGLPSFHVSLCPRLAPPWRLPFPWQQGYRFLHDIIWCMFNIVTSSFWTSFVINIKSCHLMPFVFKSILSNIHITINDYFMSWKIFS
jgi:hypothetical protein